MAGILIIGEIGPERSYIKGLLSQLFEQVHIRVLSQSRALRLTRLYRHQRLIVYMYAGPFHQAIDTIGEIRLHAARTPVIVYSGVVYHGKELLHLLRMGVNGVLLAHSSRSSHIQAIDCVLRGDPYVDELLQARILAELFR